MRFFALAPLSLLSLVVLLSGCRTESPEGACTLENFIAVALFEDVPREIPPWDKSSKANITDSARTLIRPLRRWNDYLRMTFPSLGYDFKIENFMFKHLSSIFDVSKFSNVISGLASFIASFGVGLFSIIFIAFFFVKDEHLFANIVASFIPDE